MLLYKYTKNILGMYTV